MRKLILAAALILVLAGAALTTGFEDRNTAIQREWWTVTLIDTIAPGDFNRYWMGADTTGTGRTETIRYCEFVVFEADTAGSLRFWNGDDYQYNAPSAYWRFEEDEPVEIEAKGGIDSLEVHNNAGVTDMLIRLKGKRR